MDRGTRRRASIAALIAAALASGLVGTGRAGTPWDTCPRGIGFYGDHVTVAEPPYGSNPPTSSSLAVDPADLTRPTVTNGRQVFASEDAGCTWADAFPSTRPGQAGRVTVVAREGTRTRAFVPVLQVSTGGLRAHRLRLYLKDQGESVLDLPAEMPAEECNEVQRCLVRFAPSRSLLVAYAATPGVDGLLAAVGATVDGGKTWTVRPSPVVDAKAVPVDDLAVDPEDDAHIVAIAGRRLFGSRDRGETWTALGGPTALSPTARVLFTDRPVVVDGAVHVAGEDGSFTGTAAAKVPSEPLRDVAYGPAATGNALVVAAGGGLYRQRADGGFDTLLRNASGVSQVAATSGGMWVRRTGVLGFVDVTPGQLDGPPSPPRPPRPGATPAGNLRGKADGGRLHVGGHVEVPPGGSAVTVVTGDLARQPRGLDVFFLMDTTGSMATKIRPMAQAMGRVVETMNREGISARFGLAEYGDRTFRYRRHADLGTPPAEVQRKLFSLGQTNADEFHYTSFYQLATGEGMPTVTSGGTVPPGLQASFQAGSLHVVVHATDDVDQNDPDGPREDKAFAALNAVEARHIGIFPYDAPLLSVGTSPYDDFRTVALRRYAELTSTFAPVGGLDCEGDGVVDLKEGEPIACPVLGSTGADAPIATLLERVLLSLAAVQSVALVPGTSPLAVDVRGLDDYSHVDLHEPHTGLGFRVQVQCPATERGKRVDVPLHLQVGGVTVASATLPVACLAEPPEPAPQPPAEEPPTPRRAAPRVIPGAPVIATAPSAAAQSTATAQAASQATSGANAVHAGMAVAPDDAAQLATEEEDDLHFVARTRPAPSPVGAAGLAFAVAVSLLYAVRPRVAREGGNPRW